MYYKINYKFDYITCSINNINIEKIDTIDDDIIRFMKFGVCRLDKQPDDNSVVYTIYIYIKNYDIDKSNIFNVDKETIKSLLKNELRKEKLNKLLEHENK